MRKPHDVNRIVIQKIIGYCNDIEFTLNRFGKSFDSYVSDINCRYSCDMCVLQIGELTKRLTDDFKTEHPEIIWREIKGVRNIYVHEYEKVDFEKAWTTLTQGIPELKAQLEQILAAEGENENNNA